MRSLNKLAPYIRPHMGLLSFTLLLALPLSALQASPVPLVQYFWKELVNNKNERYLLILPAAVIALYLINLVVRFCHYFLLRIVITRVNQKIRNDLYAHVLGLSSDYFTHQSTGSLISRVGSDPQYVDSGLQALSTLIKEPVKFLCLFALALKLNWELTLMIILIFPFLAWLFVFNGKALKRYIRRMTHENASLFSRMQESFTGIRIIKTFRLERYAKKKYREHTRTFAKTAMKTAAIQELSHPLVELLTAFAIAAVIYFGGHQVIAAKMTSDELLAFIAAFGIMIDPIRKLNDVNINLAQTAAAVDRIFEIFSWRSRIETPAHPIRLGEFKRSIALENVSFSYPDDPSRTVLDGFSLEIKKGAVVALVGASGSGKSTVASLIPRLYDVRSGTIKIDGVDIRSVGLHELRRFVSVVSQEVILFNDSVFENIRCGKLDARKEKVEEAARHAHAWDFIQELPNGIDSVIGDRGQMLSGGERQRLSIARAFLSDAPILILDEATSSLDTTSERAVQTALDELMENRTTLVIAHRLSTVRRADWIVVLRDGRIVEQGRHEDLMNVGGEYAEFLKMDGLDDAPVTSATNPS